jgi:hypothetical protein
MYGGLALNTLRYIYCEFDTVIAKGACRGGSIDGSATIATEDTGNVSNNIQINRKVTYVAPVCCSPLNCGAIDTGASKSIADILALALSKYVDV